MSRYNIYQVLPRLWGEGKFSSWDKLSFDYLKTLGISHVWYTGVIRHSSGKPFVKGNPGCPYSICDYYDVNPYLADNEEERMSEFECLIKSTHDNGLKVIIDFIPNHVSCDYSDFHGSIPLYDYCDYDWTDTLKIDYSASGTWNKMYDILRFWALKGVDGFRCDMVELVDVNFFGWALRKIKSEFPQIIFIAEVYGKDNYADYLEKAAFDYLYDKSGLYDNLRAIVTGNHTVRSLTWNWQSLGDMQNRMLDFLENHDEQRFASPYFAGDSSKAFPSLAMSCLFSNAPFMLYFGQEVGEDAHESDNGRTSIFNWTKPEGISALLRFIKGKEADFSFGSRMALLERYRQILGLSTLPAFSRGCSYDLCYCNADTPGFDSDRHFVFLRATENQAFMVFCNFSDSPASCDINIPPEAMEFCGAGHKKSSVHVAVAAFDICVVKF